MPFPLIVLGVAAAMQAATTGFSTATVVGAAVGGVAGGAGVTTGCYFLFWRNKPNSPEHDASLVEQGRITQEKLTGVQGTLTSMQSHLQQVQQSKEKTTQLSKSTKDIYALLCEQLQASNEIASKSINYVEHLLQAPLESSKSEEHQLNPEQAYLLLRALLAQKEHGRELEEENQRLKQQVALQTECIDSLHERATSLCKQNQFFQQHITKTTLSDTIQSSLAIPT